MLKTKCIYRLKKTDAKKYGIIDKEHLNMYFDVSSVTYLMLNSIKKKRLKKGIQYVYSWSYQLLPQIWAEALEHIIEEQNKDLYESLWHTYNGIESKALFNAKKSFYKIQNEMQEKMDIVDENGVRVLRAKNANTKD